MPDCVQKYKIIYARAEAGLGKYTDTKFQADDTSIGETVADKFKDKGTKYHWKRMSEETHGGKEYHLFEDGVGINDII